MRCKYLFVVPGQLKRKSASSSSQNKESLMRLMMEPLIENERKYTTKYEVSMTRNKNKMRGVKKDLRL